jgi:Phage integrase, N-terminal SAM-like domain
VINDEDVPGDLSRLVVPLLGSLEVTGDLFAPYRLVDGNGGTVEPVAAFFAELMACGRPPATQRSYGMDLLRWFRFLWALGVGWDQATRAEARDFIRWLQVTMKPARPHWRYPAGDAPSPRERPVAGTVNAVTGKPSRGECYGAATVAHCESVLRASFVPPKAVRDLRDYTRARARVVHERTRCWQRLEKLLESALIKLSSVASKLTTLPTQDMIKAMIAGQRDPQALAALARRTMKAKHDAPVQALDGRFDDHHGELAALLLDQIATLDAKIA